MTKIPMTETNSFDAWNLELAGGPFGGIYLGFGAWNLGFMTAVFETRYLKHLEVVYEINS